MKVIDVFSGLSWGNLSRYKELNDRTVREERAAELDQQIRALISKTKNVAWAHEALDFWASANTRSKDVFGISKEAHRLSGIKQEAEQILKQEKDRIATAHRDNAGRIDAAIKALSDAARSGYWCREVMDLDTEIKGLDREERILLKNLSMLQRLMKEAEVLLEAEALDERILSLKRVAKKDKNWLLSVDQLNEKITSQLRPLLKEKAAYEEISKEYLRITRMPIYSEYADCLTKIEGGKWSQEAVRKSFATLHNNLRKHGFAMSEYVDRFDARWAEAAKLVEKENQRVRDEERLKRERAVFQANAAKAKPYADCLSAIESGRADQQQVRNDYKNLNTGLKSLGFSITDHIEKFQSRWNEAGQKVEAAHKVAEAEKQRQKEEAERRAREERERQAAMERAANELARKRRAKQRAKERALGALKVLVTYSIPLLVMYLGGLLITNLYFGVTLLNAKWYMPFISAAAALIFVHAAQLEVDNCVSAYTICAQIFLHLGAIGFGILFGCSIVNMIFSVTLIALLMNGYPRMTQWAIKPGISIGLCFAAVGFILTLVFGLEKFLPYMIEKNFWHALWVVIAIPALSGFLGCLASMSDGYDDDAENVVVSIISMAIALTVYIRAIVWLCKPNGPGPGMSFGMFFFFVLMLISAAIGWVVSSLITIKIQDSL